MFRGYWNRPADTEQALSDGWFRSGDVVRIPDEQWGEVGLAFIVAADGTDWDAQVLRDALSGRLAAYKIPKHVRVVPSLPKTATGKVRRQDLRAAAAP